ncbi:ATPase [Arenibacter sp. 6A1]|uniref:ATPase n=1 Tax=Arenibacter sp. 6A1 TaxID=2720391 RepID=UPI001445FACE|nr:ATPase [Arenibacter sp. 6A1]NKI25743.1 ATPase [Arenibacter sp. 6A1]
MLKETNIKVITASGEKASFSLENLHNSLKNSGADEALINQIVDRVFDELYEGITTAEIYNRAFAILKSKESVFASRYKLKKAIYELGPTGFPFERFVGDILKYSGYTVTIGSIMQGVCVTHEIDVLAEKNGELNLIECKFHGQEGRNCNVKIPLYIQSRFLDVKGHWKTKKESHKPLKMGWVVTNTRFTEDAISYGKCVGLYLLSWDYPKGDGLKDRIDRLGLYPITVSTLLSNREKQFLLSRDLVLCRQLMEDKFLLDHLGVSVARKKKILKEVQLLCGKC